jgi:hypothetical protein
LIVTRLLAWLDRLPWAPLIMAAILLALAPFSPEPHLVEKLRMLSKGELTRAIDVFDLCLHSAPTLVLLAKLLREGVKRGVTRTT